ncbi:MAG: restriction system modified-DNA reader domain-containing protein [Planctomycetota bacterium]|jgi:predicted GIY-YIG superfamily endonuclease
MVRARKKSKRRVRPIVVGHLEKINSKVFDQYRKQITGLITGNYGVYALYRREKLYYIGLATDFRRRLNQHLKDRHKGKWTHFSLYLVRKIDHIREIEALLLRIAEPSGNRVKGKLKRSKNLVRELEREVKQQQEQERRVIFGGRKGKGRVKKAKGKVGDRPLKGVFAGGKMIYASYKGRAYKAWVRRNGAIVLDGRIYDSPSGAGKAVLDRGAVNGWRFWKYKDESGKLRALSSLRK